MAQRDENLSIEKAEARYWEPVLLLFQEIL